jgi:uncharacterized cupin superfamily protein
MNEATLRRTPEGLVPGGEGWFVVNARDAAWAGSEDFGRFCVFEGEARFAQYGVNIHVLEPGKPNCMYHGEADQEDFLVLAGECVLLIEGRERRLRQWDFVHCPPWTEHVLVGGGSGPCAVLMVGARSPDAAVRYPVSELARSHGAGVGEETTDARVAYARFADVESRPYQDGDLPRE